MLPLRLLTGVFNHSGHSESTILVVTQASVSQPYSHVRQEISYPSPRKFRLASGSCVVVSSCEEEAGAGSAVGQASAVHGVAGTVLHGHSLTGILMHMCNA